MRFFGCLLRVQQKIYGQKTNQQTKNEKRLTPEPFHTPFHIVLFGKNGDDLTACNMREIGIIRML